MKIYRAHVTVEDGVYLGRIEELHANTEADTFDELVANLVESAQAAGAEDFTVTLANPILEDLRAARAAGDDYTSAEDWLVNLSDMSVESDAWTYTPEDIAEAEAILRHEAGRGA